MSCVAAIWVGATTAGLEALGVAFAEMPADAVNEKTTRADEINRRMLRDILFTEKRLCEDAEKSAADCKPDES
jgi:hypothetical protein